MDTDQSLATAKANLGLAERFLHDFEKLHWDMSVFQVGVTPWGFQSSKEEEYMRFRIDKLKDCVTSYKEQIARLEDSYDESYMLEEGK